MVEKKLFLCKNCEFDKKKEKRKKEEREKKKEREATTLRLLAWSPTAILSQLYEEGLTSQCETGCGVFLMIWP